MPHSNFLKHPVLTVAINAEDVDKQPSYFWLITDAGLPSVMARLAYPRSYDSGVAGESVTVSLVAGEERIRYFTGAICNVYDEGKLRVLELTDGYKKLCDTPVTPAYRKETAKAILQDTLDAAGITETSIACPAVEIGRFSEKSITAARCIDLLIKALEEHGVTGLRYFFDAENRFHFGIDERNPGAVISFENIISAGNGYIEVLPYPIRHSQSVIVDGVARLTLRTELMISRSSSRLRIWI
jgi:hypothetical protein